MNCDICPVRNECTSARGVAARSISSDEKSVLDRLQIICPLEELMYSTFSIAVLNLRRQVNNEEHI